ncbi:MAG: isoprenoid biosynthesis glyoxalase ElbB [Desulfobacterium sp.]|nr:isoprenoid biosynthesis glyoxalase ElbB [Desulfobacterium sp.]MBU3946635.1 isoprenoid biosynthesis glyoxalase ElbB [Pseudomonadota bacterium]MBU4037260.1 isoprenoid biosynthesis glyoxalase ElbB [Pseudomonadota bacterium]
MPETSYHFAVILAGCGNKDGSEIHESVSTLLAIDRAGAKYSCFAPDTLQYKVLNHITGEPMAEKRNILIESARIARGNIRNLKEFNADEFDALVMPGGFGGAALSLCTFGIDGDKMRVNPDLERAVSAMVAQKKPIGALCIAPVILARMIPNVKITFGQDEETNSKARKMGAVTVNTQHGEIVVDYEHRVVTTPCYMLNARISQVYDGAEKLVAEMLSLVTSA